MTFVVRPDRSMIACAPCERLLLIDVQAPRADHGKPRAPVCLSLVVDRSGSMAGDKLKLALAAAREAIRALNQQDRFSVVTFDDKIDVVVASTAATRAAQIAAETELDVVRSGNSTDLAGGWLTGCAEIGGALGPDDVGRCLVLTDGQANHGITDPVELAQHARELRARRVTTSTLGLGVGFNEFLLGRLAEEGGGNFYFAERAEELAAIVAHEIGEVLSVIARDVTVVVTAPDGVVVESLNHHPCTRAGGAWSFAVGSLSASQGLAAVFRLRIPGGAMGEAVGVDTQVLDRDGVLPHEPRALVWRRCPDVEVVREPADPAVAQAAALQDAAIARRAALAQNQGGDPEQAGRVIDDAVARLRAGAQGDAHVLDCAQRLADERERYARPLSSLLSKQAYLAAMQSQKQRSVAPPASGLRAAFTSAALETSLKDAVQALRGLDGLAAIEIEAPQRGAALTPAVLLPDDEARLCGAPVSGQGVTVLFVEQPLKDGWFSHWHAGPRTAVVSCAGFTGLTGLRTNAFVAYELLFHGLRTQSLRYDPLALSHSDTRGCLFDLCVDKAEIAVKLQAGHICEPCRRALADVGLDAGKVARLWSAVQALAHPGGAA